MDAVHRDAILQRREPALWRARRHARARPRRLALVGEDLEPKRVQLDRAGQYRTRSTVPPLVYTADGKPCGLEPYALAAVGAEALEIGIANPRSLFEVVDRDRRIGQVDLQRADADHLRGVGMELGRISP